MMLTEFPEKARPESGDMFLLQNSSTNIYSRVSNEITPVTVFFTFPNSVTVTGNESETVTQMQGTAQQLFVNRTLVDLYYEGTLTFTRSASGSRYISLQNGAVYEGGIPLCVNYASTTGNNGFLTCKMEDNLIYLFAESGGMRTPLQVSNGNPITITDLRITVLLNCDITYF